MKPLIIVEGVADEQFFKAFLRNDEAEFMKMKGDFDANIENIKVSLSEANKQGRLVLFIVDDDKIPDREESIKNKLESDHSGLDYRLFLVGDISGNGNLEDFLIAAMQEHHQPKIQCFLDYRKCVSNAGGVAPNDKTFVWLYCHSIGIDMTVEKEPSKRNYLDTRHWNLNAEMLMPLKKFLIKNLDLKYE
jgi:hypothetical protein